MLLARIIVRSVSNGENGQQSYKVTDGLRGLTNRVEETLDMREKLSFIFRPRVARGNKEASPRTEALSLATTGGTV
jgi:hypothetical protein